MKFDINIIIVVVVVAVVIVVAPVVVVVVVFVSAMELCSSDRVSALQIGFHLLA